MNFIKKHVLFIIFISFLLSLIFLTYKGYGIPWDEKIFFSTGKYYVAGLFNYFQIPTNLSTSGFEPTPYHLRGHGVFMDILTVFLLLPLRSFNFETLHLIRALLSLPIFFLLYLIVSKLISKVYGLISLVFLLLFPRFYPEIFYNAVDIPAALLFTISIAYFIYYSTTKQTVLKSILFGFILGVTINQRLLLFYLPILNFIFLFFQQRTNLKQFVIHQSVIFLSLIISLHLTHPYLLTHPITGLFDILKSAKQYPWNAAVLFEGQFYQAGVKPLPWYYLPKTMLITIPLSTLLLFLMGNIRILFSIIKNQAVRKVSSTPEVEAAGNMLYFYIFLIFYTPIFLTFILKPTLYDSWRQFLFLTIPIIIIAMYGLEWTIHPLLSKPLKSILLLFVGLNLIFTLLEMKRLHPLEYLYYNQLVGGLKGAYGKYETDYWGLGYKEGVLWFNKNINDPKKNYKIFAEGDPLSSSYYFKPNMALTTDLSTADYLFTFTRWNFHLRHPGKTIHRVEREGVPLIFIKKLSSQ